MFEKEIKIKAQEQTKSLEIENPEQIAVVLAVRYPKFSGLLTEEELDSRISNLIEKRKREGETAEVKEMDAQVTDDLRGNLTFQTIVNLRQMGVFPVIVNDGCSQAFLDLMKAPEMKSEWGDNQVIHEGNEQGYSASRRLGMQKARDHLRVWGNEGKGLKDCVIIQMEPEKTALATPEMISALIKPIREDRAKVAILRRGFEVNEIPSDVSDWHILHKGDNSMGYPPYQFYSESHMNRYMGKLLGRLGHDPRIEHLDPDFLNGTRAISAADYGDFFTQHEIAGKATYAKPEVYFDAVYASFFYFAKNGTFMEDVASVDFNPREGESFYPPLQAKLEGSSPMFTAKRDSQRNQLEEEMKLLFNRLASVQMPDAVMSEKQNIVTEIGHIEDFILKELPDKLSKVCPNGVEVVYNPEDSRDFQIVRKSSDPEGGKIIFESDFSKLPEHPQGSVYEFHIGESVSKEELDVILNSLVDILKTRLKFRINLALSGSHRRKIPTPSPETIKNILPLYKNFTLRFFVPGTPEEIGKAFDTDLEIRWGLREPHEGWKDIES